MKLNTKFDLQNQRVIKTDVLRTKTGYLTETEMHSLELLLTYYCKDTNTSYKQGMNEIFSNFGTFSNIAARLKSNLLKVSARKLQFLLTNVTQRDKCL